MLISLFSTPTSGHPARGGWGSPYRCSHLKFLQYFLKVSWTKSQLQYCCAVIGQYNAVGNTFFTWNLDNVSKKKNLILKIFVKIFPKILDEAFRQICWRNIWNFLFRKFVQYRMIKILRKYAGYYKFSEF